MCNVDHELVIGPAAGRHTTLFSKKTYLTFYQNKLFSPNPMDYLLLRYGYAKTTKLIILWLFNANRSRSVGFFVITF